MSYDIYIGNAQPVYPDPADEDDGYFAWRVEHVTNDAAPEWPNPASDPIGSLVDISGKTNGRHPGYIQMREWSKRVGLEDLFFNEQNGLLRPHPGICRLLPHMLAEVQEALAKYQTKHPGKVPGWGDNESGDLAKLIWYEFWMRWALANCAWPAVENH